MVKRGQRLSECTLKAESAWATSRLELECEKGRQTEALCAEHVEAEGAIQEAGEMQGGGVGNIDMSGLRSYWFEQSSQH